jgi:integrase
MARTVNKLTAAFVAKNTKVCRANDGAGLYLQTSHLGNNVTKAWLFRFKLNGRKREMGLGSVNTYTLAEARERARKCRQLVDQGIDPIEQRKTQRAEAMAEAAKRLTFAEAAEAFVEDNRNGWRSRDHGRQWATSLRDYVLPTLGALPIGAIETAHVVKTLRQIWESKPETASRVRGRIEMVLDWAGAGGFRSGDNPARWKGHLENILPKRAAFATVEHHAAMPLAEVPMFMTRLAVTPGTAARALEMLVLTAVRRGELLGARWGELEPLATALWVIPAARTKSNREHRVPLAPHVVAMLETLAREKTSLFVFPGLVSPDRPLGHSKLRQVLHDVGGAAVTLHGFRSAFRDWAGDHSTVAREVAEAALGHVVGDQSERAYRRGDALAKRRELMEDWADFCTESQRNA